AEQQAIVRAANKWSEHTCSGGGSPSIKLARGADYANRDNGDTQSTLRHIIYFEEDDWGADSQTVAVTNTQYVIDTGFIITSDMIFNGVTFQFRARDAGGTLRGCSGGQSCYDVEPVALHEFGHFLGFNHVLCADASMFPQGSPSGGPVDLTMHEKAGLCAVY